MRQIDWRRRGQLLVLLAGAMSAGSSALSQTKPPATVPSGAAALSAGWEEIDQRLVFLTVELSSVESSLAAVNKSIHINGYERSTRLDDAEHARKGNELMDRNGGGPVSWQDFYGRTAEQFFYHPTDDGTVYINPRPRDQRPPQFDYIYQANADNQSKAEEEAAKLGNKEDELLARRRQLETEQSALWCKIALRAVSSRELADHPLYRFDLTNAGADEASHEHLDAIKAGAEFMRQINAAVDQAQSGLDGDQKAALDQLLQASASARDGLTAQMIRQATIAPALDDAHSAIGQFSRSAKRLADSAQNVVDAYRLANDGDLQGDADRKNNFRGQMQRMIMDFAATVVTADQKLSAAAVEWNVLPNRDKPSAAIVSAAQSPAISNDSPGTRLDRAKTDYLNSVSEARHNLVAAIDRQLNAATDAGDLNLVRSLQTVKSSAETDGSVPDDVKDTAIISAKSRYAQSITSANQRLANSFRQAVRDYTRARNLDDAQAVQAEFESTGLPALTAAAPVVGEAGGRPGNLFQLASKLPPYLDSGSPYAIVKDGIRPEEHKYLRTTDADFIDRDFTFDVSFIAERDEKSAWVGIGEGLRNGGYFRPNSSIAIEIQQLGHLDGEVGLHKEGENLEHVGKLPDTGEFVARVQKTGRTITFSVGTEREGLFRPDMSKRIDDIRKFAPFLNDHNSHLFFGNNTVFKQVRLVLSGGPPLATAGDAATPQNSATPVVVNIKLSSAIETPAHANSANPAESAGATGGNVAPANSPPAALQSSSPAEIAAAPLAAARLESGLTGDYFADMRFEKVAATRVDPFVDFSWKSGAKPAEGMSTPRYSVRWSGVIVIPAGGVLGIGVAADDAARLIIDGKQLFEFHNPGQKLDPGPFTAGRHKIVLEYWNRVAAGHAKLLWVPTGKIDPEPVPPAALFHERAK